MKDKLKFRFLIFIILAILLSFLIGCSSRYRTELSIVTDTFSASQKAELNKYYKNAALNNPFREEKIIPGDKNIAVLDLTVRGKKLESSPGEFLTFDEIVKLRIYLQFNSQLSPGVTQLKDNAFISLRENYELSEDDKIFVPVTGELSLDSVSGKHIFASVNGSFFNKKEQKIELSGTIKIRIRN